MTNRSFEVFAVVQAAIVAALLWFVFSRPGPWDWLRGLGTALMLIGIAGIATARFQLGRSFSVSAQARQLVTQGIYSKIRNPIYVFGTVMIAGFVLILRQPIGWIFVLVVACLQVIRAHKEAQVLETAFGDEYREYRRKTWF